LLRNSLEYSFSDGFQSGKTNEALIFSTCLRSKAKLIQHKPNRDDVPLPLILPPIPAATAPELTFHFPKLKGRFRSENA